MKYKFSSFLLLVLLVFSFISCSSRGELYDITDEFVKELETKYSYNVFESGTDKKVTKDGVYQVMPSGRLIIVKFLNYAEEGEYESLKNDLSSHYSGDKRVNDVYINRGGTVVVDCRE